MNGLKEQMRSLVTCARKSSSILLDTAGIILLSGSASTFGLTVGLAASGVGCFFLNWRLNEGRTDRR